MNVKTTKPVKHGGRRYEADQVLPAETFGQHLDGMIAKGTLVHVDDVPALQPAPEPEARQGKGKAKE